MLPTKRDAFLDVFEIQRDPQSIWMWSSAIVLFGTWAGLGIGASYYAISTCKHDGKHGTQRVHDEVIRRMLSKRRSTERKSFASHTGPTSKEEASWKQKESAAAIASIDDMAVDVTADSDLDTDIDAMTECDSESFEQSTHSPRDPLPTMAASSFYTASSRCIPTTVSFSEVRYTVPVPSSSTSAAKYALGLDEAAAFEMMRVSAGFVRHRAGNNPAETM